MWERNIWVSTFSCLWILQKITVNLEKYKLPIYNTFIKKIEFKAHFHKWVSSLMKKFGGGHSRWHSGDNYIRLCTQKLLLGMGCRGLNPSQLYARKMPYLLCYTLPAPLMKFFDNEMRQRLTTKENIDQNLS